MTQQIDSSLSNERIFARLTGGFGLLALLLASIGIYGIMAYTVARRTGEIGIRMALGARADQVLSMILREASWMALTGVLVGIGVALWLSRFINSMLYGLTPADPLTLAGAGALLIAIALLAGLGPARRASRIDPIRALRHE
jgi:ABC-type antimicrobial peptide transport system permease subunit